MAISGIADYTGYDPDYIPDKPGDELGKYDFLKLLVAQLQHQDPLEPMDNNEFMTQMTAMSQLEQIQNLNTNFEEMMTSQGLIYSSQLIGQTVKAIDQTTRSVIEGTVGQVSVEDGEVKVQVGDTTVALKDIISVTPLTSSNSILQASQMIGLQVTAMDPNDFTGFNTISGIVEEVSLYNGEVSLKFTDLTSGYTYTIGLGDIIAVTKPEESPGDGEGSGEGDLGDDSGSEGSGDEGSDGGGSES